MLGFNDIIGHEEIIRHLKNAYRQKKCPIRIFLQVTLVLERNCWQEPMR